jgi:hypothetical protein
MDKPVIRGICAELIEALVPLVEIVEDDHYKCNIDSDEYCVDVTDTVSAVEYIHGAIRQARQAIAMAKGVNDG